MAKRTGKVDSEVDETRRATQHDERSTSNAQRGTQNSIERYALNVQR
jgi:hypothetical protein